MRIDLNRTALPELDRSPSSTAGSKGEVGRAASEGAGGEDVARLSTGSAAIQPLGAQLNAVPDIRQQRVEELRQAVNSGSFPVHPERVAAAMLADVSRSR